MNTKYNRGRKTNKRSGFTVIEIGIVLLVGLGLIAAAVGAYKKIYIPQQGDAAFSQISSVMNGIERSKLTSGGTYPVGSTAKIPTIVNLLNELGGADNTADISDWTYDCDSGSGKTITLVTTAYSDPIIAALAATKITSNKSPWSATASSSVVTATLSNAICK
jgi:Tfp pilus assembly protein PilE